MKIVIAIVILAIVAVAIALAFRRSGTQWARDEAYAQLKALPPASDLCLPRRSLGVDGTTNLRRVMSDVLGAP
jgi:hypothetical protein